MGSGDRDASPQRCDLSEQIRAVKLAPARGLALGVPRGHGGRVHDLRTGGHVGGGVADQRLDPVLVQALRVARLGAVRARDPGAERLRHERKATHAGTTDADEVKLA